MFFGNNVDFSQNQLVRAVIEKGAAFPTAPAPISGQVFYKTSAVEGFYYYKIDHWEPVMSLVADSVTLEIYDNGGQATVRIKDAGVTAAKLAADSVITVKVLDKNITFAKFQDIPSMTVVGRVAAGAGVASAISIISDIGLAGASDSALATSLAIKTYVDGRITGMGSLEGTIVLPTQTTFPVGSNGTKKGDMWYCTGTTGTIGGIVLRAGDIIMANIDGASTTLGTDWSVMEGNKDIATTTVLGIVMLASVGDMTPDVMTEASKVVTPALLESVVASPTKKGLIKKANSAQGIAGAIDDAAITPLVLKAVLDDRGNESVLLGGALINNVVHTRNTLNPSLNLYKVSDGMQVYTTINIIDANTVRVTFGTPSSPAVGAYRLVIGK